MKSLTAFIACASLTAVTAFGHADDDIGPDKAVELLNAGTIKPFEQLNAAALAAHPGGMIGDTELEQEYGKYVYKVELRDSEQREWDIDIDATTGAVLSDRQDD